MTIATTSATPATAPLVFRNKNFALLWVGQLLSQCGTRMYQIALLWWIMTSVGSAQGVTLGAFLVIGSLPSLIFVKHIGSLVDRAPRKALLVTADLTSFGAVLVLLALFFNFNSSVIFYAVFGIEAILATTQAIIDPSFSRVLPELVAKEDYERAVAFQTSTQSMANFGGAVAGAFLFSLMGVKGAITVNALSYGIAAAASFFVAFQKAAKQGEQSQSPSDQGPEVDRSVFGTQPWLKKVLFGFGLVNFFSTPTLVILPLYTKKVLSGDASTLGLLEAAVWCGLLVGSFSTRLFGRMKNTVALGGLALGTLGAALIVPGIVVNQALYIVALFIGHFMLGVNNVRFVTLFQDTVADSLKGRFFALVQAIVSFTFPIAFFAFGLLGDLFSPMVLCVIQGCGIVVLALYFVRLSTMIHARSST